MLDTRFWILDDSIELRIEPSFPATGIKHPASGIQFGIRFRNNP